MNIHNSFASLICFLSLVACGKKQASNQCYESDAKLSLVKMSYAEFAESEYTGLTTDAIKHILGNPSMIKQTARGEVWHYGPDVDALLMGESKAIIGVTINFDAKGVVLKVSPTIKTTSVIPSHRNR